MTATLRNHLLALITGLAAGCSPTSHSCAGPVDECEGKAAGQICTLENDVRGQCLPDEARQGALRCFPAPEKLD